MKKFLALLLAVIMCLTFSSCGEPKPVELTVENIDEYLSGRIIYGQAFLGVQVPITVEISPKVSGTFENVKLVFSEPLPARTWQLVESDSSYKYVKEKIENDRSGRNYLITEINLPANGQYSEKHEMETYLISGELDKVPDESEISFVCYDYEYGELISVPKNEIDNFMVSEYLPEGTPCVTGTFIPDK